MGELEATASKADVVREAFTRMNRHDPRGASELWREDALWHTPDGVVTGAEAVVAFFEEIFVGLPDAHFEPITFAEQGDDVFVQWRLTGHQTGWFGGLAPTGRPVSLDGVDHMVVRDGRVVLNTLFFDQVTVGRQLGTMPQAGSRAERLMKLAVNLRTRLLPKRGA